MNSHSDETEVVRQLFREHVPAVASGAVEIRGIVRKAGFRSVLAVSSKDPTIDPVGTCVGNRGERVKAIVEALDMEHIDIVRWGEPAERFIHNLLSSVARVIRVSFDEAAHEVTALLSPHSQGPGPRTWPRFSPSGMPVSDASKHRLALLSELFSKLTGWRLKLELA